MDMCMCWWAWQVHSVRPLTWYPRMWCRPWKAYQTWSARSR